MMQEMRKWELDKAHSSIEFSARHMMIANVRGHFEKFDGDIQMDVLHPESGKVDFKVQAETITTSEPDRDKHLRSSDFLDVSNHPYITFVSRKISRVKDEVTVEGDLTIRGISRPISVSGPLAGPIKDAYGHDRIGFDGEVAINRKEFGLNWNMILEAGGVLVGDIVKLGIHLELTSN